MSVSDEVLEHVQVLRLLPEDARRLVEASFVPVSFGFGELIVEEGSAADGFYVIVSGSARVLRRADSGDEMPLASLGPGDTFGEIALLEDGDRTSSVRASSQVEALKLDRSVVRAVLESSPEIREHFEQHVARLRLRDLFRLSSPLASLEP